MCLSDAQASELARPLVTIITEFFSDNTKEEEFQSWLREYRKRKDTILS